MAFYLTSSHHSFPTSSSNLENKQLGSHSESRVNTGGEQSYLKAPFLENSLFDLSGLSLEISTHRTLTSQTQSLLSEISPFSRGILKAIKTDFTEIVQESYHISFLSLP